MIKKIIGLGLLASSVCSLLMAETYKVEFESVCKINNDITRTSSFSFINEKGIETNNYTNKKHNDNVIFEESSSFLITKENKMVIKYDLTETVAIKYVVLDKETLPLKEKKIKNLNTVLSLEAALNKKTVLSSSKYRLHNRLENRLYLDKDNVNKDTENKDYEECSLYLEVTNLK